MVVTVYHENERIRVCISGQVNSAVAPELEKQVLQLPADQKIVLDLQEMDYISSAGLRVILKLWKQSASLELINSSNDVFATLDMTGFTEMMKVSRTLREISLEGAVLIGRGANGEVYRINDDTVVKVYLHTDALQEIERERILARKALILGIPTAISYDMVKVGNHYATMFEMVQADSLSGLLMAHPEKIEEYASLYMDLLNQIHAIQANDDSLPQEKNRFLSRVADLEAHLPPAVYAKLRAMAEALPEDRHIIHGDYHTKNIMLQNGEAILIDMDTLAMGNPILELGVMYNAFIGYGLYDPENCAHFLAMPKETISAFWKQILQLYAPDASDEELALIEKKAKLVGLSRIVRKKIMNHASQEEIALYLGEVIKLTEELDTLQ